MYIVCSTFLLVGHDPSVLPIKVSYIIKEKNFQQHASYSIYQNLHKEDCVLIETSYIGCTYSINLKSIRVFVWCFLSFGWTSYFFRHDRLGIGEKSIQISLKSVNDRTEELAHIKRRLRID